MRNGLGGGGEGKGEGWWGGGRELDGNLNGSQVGLNSGIVVFLLYLFNSFFLCIWNRL